MPDTRVRGFVLDIVSFDLEEIFLDDGQRGRRNRSDPRGFRAAAAS